MTQDAFEAQFDALYNDPEPILRQAVRVFMGEDTLFPGFQIIDGALSPTVLALFDKALELQVPTTCSPPGWSLRYPTPEAGALWMCWHGKIASFRHSTLTPGACDAAAAVL
jgi:hypothetical protein